MSTIRRATGHSKKISSTAVFGITTYSYHAAGNRRAVESPSGDLTTSTWNGENQLDRVEPPSGEVVTYVWDPVNKLSEERIVTRDDGVTPLTYLWDNNNVLRETDDLETPQAEYTYQPQPYGDLVSQRRDAESSYYRFDALGSNIALTDGSGTVTDTARYQAFGRDAQHDGTTETPYRWIGKVGYRRDDASGLCNLRARDYDPNAGRFLSQDPLGLAAGDANFYRYVGNDPSNSIDPSGYTIMFLSEAAANAFAEELRQLGATAVVVVRDETADGSCYHVYTSFQDTNAVFAYADAHFNVFTAQVSFPFIPPNQQTLRRLAERRAKFLAAVLTNPARIYASVDGRDPPCDSTSLTLIQEILKKLAELNAKVTVKLDIGGEGRGNQDRINFNIVCRGTMGGTTLGQNIPQLIPKTELRQNAPFMPGTVDEVYIENLFINEADFKSVVRDAMTVLKKPGGRLIVQSPCRPDDHFQWAREAIREAGYRYQYTREVSPDPNDPDLDVCTWTFGSFYPL
jgi:RHS repeat-associated protein